MKYLSHIQPVRVNTIKIARTTLGDENVCKNIFAIPLQYCEYLHCNNLICVDTSRNTFNIIFILAANFHHNKRKFLAYCTISEQFIKSIINNSKIYIPCTCFGDSFHFISGAISRHANTQSHWHILKHIPTFKQLINHLPKGVKSYALATTNFISFSFQTFLLCLRSVKLRLSCLWTML